jgi:hypothetical protein
MGYHIYAETKSYNIFVFTINKLKLIDMYLYYLHKYKVNGKNIRIFI